MFGVWCRVSGGSRRKETEAWLQDVRRGIAVFENVAEAEAEAARLSARMNSDSLGSGPRPRGCALPPFRPLGHGRSQNTRACQGQLSLARQTLSFGEVGREVAR